jgi:hypothetical protein
VTIAGYDSIRALFLEQARLEGNTLCRYEGSIYLQIWVDCNQFLIGPAWRSVWTPSMSLHGLTLVCAYDMETGEGAPLPVTAPELELSIEWENWQARIDPQRQNQDWVKLIMMAEQKSWSRLWTLRKFLEEQN